MAAAMIAELTRCPYNNVCLRYQVTVVLVHSKCVQVARKSEPTDTLDV